jgi:hypothetical protein
MTSLGKSQGRGDNAAAGRGRQCVVEALRMAGLIRSDITRHVRHTSVWSLRLAARERVRIGANKLPKIEQMFADLDALDSRYLNQARGPVIRVARQR